MSVFVGVGERECEAAHVIEGDHQLGSCLLSERDLPTICLDSVKSFAVRGFVSAVKNSISSAARMLSSTVIGLRGSCVWRWRAGLRR